MTSELNHHRRRAGFTLVEMLIVLAILAITTTIAVQSLVPVASEARRDSTARTLANVASAVISVNKSTVSGFLADTGRVPVYSSSMSTAPYSVDELTGFYPASNTYGPPADLGTYQAVAFPMTLMVASTSTTNGVTTTTWSKSPDPLYVTVNSGWNGPYLLAPSGSYAAGSATSIVDGWSQALPAFLYPDASNGSGMTIWSTGDPSVVTPVPVSTTLVPSTLAASTVIFSGCNSSGVPATPSSKSPAYYYAVFGPAPASQLASAPSSITAGGPYEAALGTPIGANPAPAVYQYVVAYSPSCSLAPMSTTAPFMVPGLGPRVFCILDSSGYIVSGPIYQVILPGSNTVNFLVQ